jgi:hypothetical protein
MSLYQINEELQGILDTMLDGGVNSPEAMDALAEHLKELDGALDAKAESYAGIIMELEARAEMRMEESYRIKALASADNALASRLRERLKSVMESTGRTRIETNRFRLTVATNGGKQPLDVKDDAVAILPKDMVVTTLTPDRDKIRAALECGMVVPGCTLMPRATSLRIK